MTQIRVFVLLVTVVSSALCAPIFAQTCSLPSFSQTPVYSVAGADIRSVAAADFDGDGSPDLGVANADTSNVTVILKAGRAEPAIIDTYAVGTFPLSVATGDFTGDGKIDIISANDSASSISLLRNNGSGGFVPAGAFNVGAGPVDIAVGDFNNNGTLDVLAAGDVNKDGKLDLVVADIPTAKIQIYLGNGTGCVGASTSIDVLNAGCLKCASGTVSESTKIKHRGASRRWRRRVWLARHSASRPQRIAAYYSRS